MQTLEETKKCSQCITNNCGCFNFVILRKWFKSQIAASATGKRQRRDTSWKNDEKLPTQSPVISRRCHSTVPHPFSFTSLDRLMHTGANHNEMYIYRFWVFQLKIFYRKGCLTQKRTIDIESKENLISQPFLGQFSKFKFLVASFDISSLRYLMQKPSKIFRNCLDLNVEHVVILTEKRMKNPLLPDLEQLTKLKPHCAVAPMCIRNEITHFSVSFVRRMCVMMRLVYERRETKLPVSQC